MTTELVRKIPEGHANLRQFFGAGKPIYPESVKAI